MPKGTHIERARGSYSQNYAYCTKAGPGGRVPRGQFGEFGDWAQKGQGRRSESIVVAEALKEEPDLLKVLDEHTAYALKYYRNMELLHGIFHLQKMKRYISPSDTDYRWYYGDSGAGKTEAVFNEFPHDSIYVKTSNNKWWDNYDPIKHTVVIIDDYRDNRELPYAALLNIMDTKPYQCEVKGLRGGLPLLAKIIIITCNKLPSEIWPRDEQIDPIGVSPSGRVKWTLMMRRLHTFTGVKLKQIVDPDTQDARNLQLVNDLLRDLEPSTPPPALNILPKDMSPIEWNDNVLVPARLVGADVVLSDKEEEQTDVQFDSEHIVDLTQSSDEDTEKQMF